MRLVSSCRSPTVGHLSTVDVFPSLDNEEMVLPNMIKSVSQSGQAGQGSAQKGVLTFKCVRDIFRLAGHPIVGDQDVVRKVRLSIFIYLSISRSVCVCVCVCLPCILNNTTWSERVRDFTLHSLRLGST